jgi:hypothetical protein
LTVQQVGLPDNTINTPSDDGTSDLHHTCLVAQSEHPVAKLELTTTVKSH